MSDVDGLYAFQWIWESVTGLPEDSYVNTWHFQMDAFLASDFDNVRDLLFDFYTDTPGDQPQPLTYFMTNHSLSGNYVLKAYLLTDPKPRAVAYETSGAVTFNTNAALPTEVASVFSFQAEQESGENQKRRRNRIYLGPLGVSSSDDYSRMDDTMVASMLFAGRNLTEAAAAAVTWSWVVYSPTDDATYPVNNGWVDNAFDTQRRRGLQSTARGTFGDGYPT